MAPVAASRAERVVEEGDDVDPGQGAVVDVPGDEHDVHALGPHDLDEVVDEGRLGAEQPDPVEGPSEVPVGGVEDPHAGRL